MGHVFVANFLTLDFTDIFTSSETAHFLVLSLISGATYAAYAEDNIWNTAIHAHIQRMTLTAR